MSSNAEFTSAPMFRGGDQSKPRAASSASAMPAAMTRARPIPMGVSVAVNRPYPLRMMRASMRHRGGGTAMAGSIGALRRRLKRQSTTRGRCRGMSCRAASSRRIAGPTPRGIMATPIKGEPRMSVPAEESGPGSPAIADAHGSRLDSWKEIATHLGRDVRTVQRWEARDGLPVRRLQHSKTGSVFAYAAELDAWRDGRDPRAEERRSSETAVMAAGRWRLWAAAAALISGAAIAIALVAARARPRRRPTRTRCHDSARSPCCRSPTCRRPASRATSPTA